MKKSLVVLFMLLSVAGFCQNQTLTGSVKDIVTLLPVELVSISVEGSNVGTVTNEEGLFRITLPTGAAKLKFTHLNYNSYEFVIDPQKSEAEIHLEPKSFTLDEIVLSSVPVNDLLSLAVKASKSKLEKSLLMNTYGREFVSINDRFTTFADGMLDYNIKKQNGKSDLYVQQSRAFKLQDPEFAKKQQNADGMALFDIREAIADAYNFKFIKQLLDGEDYDYELRLKTDDKGNSLEIVRIIPKENVHSDLFEGTVTYESKSKLILEIDVKKAPSHQQYNKEINALIMKLKLNEYARKSVFKMDGDKYIMSYNRNKLNFHVRMKNQFDDSFEFLSDIVTLDYKDGEFELDRDKRYKEKSLYRAGTKFTNEYWKTNNVMLLSAGEQRVVDELK